MADTTTVDPRTSPRLSEPGDHERFAHIIRKSDWGSGYMEGRAVEALCGKKWVPTRDPDRFPLCPECKELAEALGIKPS
jgi:hypothetical protein